MEMKRESRIVLDPAGHAPHACRMRDESADPAAGRLTKTGSPKATSASKTDKAAKLAAALRANLARRKAAARQARAPSSLSPKLDDGEI
jgi:hypothetical protein